MKAAVPPEPVDWAALDPDDWPHTPPLDVYRKLAEADSNLFWRLPSGHAQNLLEDALDRLEQVEKLAEPDGMWKGRKHYRITEAGGGVQVTRSYVLVNDLRAALAGED